MALGVVGSRLVCCGVSVHQVSHVELVTLYFTFFGRRGFVVRTWSIHPHPGGDTALVQVGTTSREHLGSFGLVRVLRLVPCVLFDSLLSAPTLSMLRRLLKSAELLVRDAGHLPSRRFCSLSLE